MMRRIAAAVIASLALASAAPAEDLGTQRHVVAVLDFAEQGDIDKGSGHVAAELLEVALVNTGRFEVVERGRLESVTSELELGLTGLVSGETAQRIGEIVGAEVIITGSVYRLEGVMGINTKLVATRDASIITADRAQSKTKTSVNALVDEILPLIIEDFPLRGYVIEREGDVAIIDLGRNVGISPGKEFKVYMAGKELRSTVTNEILHREEIDKGVLRVVSVTEKTASCRISSEEQAGSIVRGDLIKSIGFEVNTAGSIKPSRPPAAKPKPEPAAASASWAKIPGAPTILMTKVYNRSGRAAHSFAETLREAVGDELVRLQVANPVLTDLIPTSDIEDIVIPHEYLNDRPYLMLIVVKDFDFDSDGDAEVGIVCRVYDPLEDDVIFKKSFEFEPDGGDYRSKEQLLAQIRTRVAKGTAMLLQKKLD